MALTTNYIGVLETQIDKGQDYVLRGKKRNGNVWFAVFDGHGGNAVIDKLRSLDFNIIMEKPNPAHEIQKIITDMGDTFKSGSTMSIIIISDTTIKCFWKGDSTIKIYKNNNLHVTCDNHDSVNQREMARIEKLNIPTKMDWCMEILGKTRITMKPSPYFMLSAREGVTDQTNMTNCLGHNGVLGDFIEEKTIELTPDDDFAVIVASDGLWDIVSPDDTDIPYMDCHELTEFAKERWMQEWCYEYEDHPTQMTKLGKGDDIAVGIWKGKFIPLD
jgi:serine/threonine protein phosphatase PrpC